ncbi:hypothetical protein D3C80_2095190 [compost metagenome]
MNKGDALLYFNTDTNARLDPLTEHEASPIITGTKWIAVKWLRQVCTSFIADTGHENVYLTPCSIYDRKNGS